MKDKPRRKDMNRNLQKKKKNSSNISKNSQTHSLLAK